MMVPCGKTHGITGTLKYPQSLYDIHILLWHWKRTDKDVQWFISPKL